jgi:hypothetical protein
VGWYLDTWRTPYWRRVLSTLLFGASFVAWLATLEQAKRGVERGEPWTALAAAAVPGLVVAAALLAAGAWPLSIDARRAGRSPLPELRAAAGAALALAAYGAAKVASIRHPAVAAWLPAAVCAAIGAGALARARPRWPAWAWAAAWLAAAAWLGARAWSGSPR